tara:strand:+ start:2104 stop:3903 length:1800 start_codon:yes stop_codon:yes gene_type:complete
MAEATIRDLIKVIQAQDRASEAQNMMGLAATDRVRDEVGKLGNLFVKYFIAQKAAEGDKLEAQREANAQTKASKQGARAKKGGKGFSLFPIETVADSIKSLLLKIPSLVLPITGGIAAIGLAIAGLRGWELPALKYITDLKNFPTSVQNAVTSLRTAALGVFGLNAAGELDDAGKPAPSIRKQIGMRMNALRIRTLAMFGLGADGKVIPLKGADDILDPKNNIVGRAFFRIKQLLDPLMKVTTGVAKFTGGIGKDLFNFISKFITPGAAVFGTVMKRVLYPIGILMSAFKGVQAFNESDEEGFAKLGDGIGAMVGNFIGAPFDLLKRGIRWLWNNAFELTPDENGKVSDASLAGKISNMIGEFSFEEAISSVVGFPFKILQGMIDFVTDPAARKQMIGSAKETLQGWGESFSQAIANLAPSIQGFADGVRKTLRKIVPAKVFAFLYPDEAARLEAIGSGGEAGEEYARSRMAERQMTAKKNATLEDLLKFDVNGDMFLSPEEIEAAGGLGFVRGNRELRKMLKARRNSLSPGLITGVGLDAQTKFRSKVQREGLDLRMRDAVGNVAPSAPVIIEGSRSVNNQGIVTGDPRPFDRVISGY